MEKFKKTIANYRPSLFISIVIAELRVVKGFSLRGFQPTLGEPVALVVQATVTAFGSCGTCGSPLKFVRTFLVRPSFAFSILWPPSRGLCSAFAVTRCTPHLFLLSFPLFHWSFFPFLIFNFFLSSFLPSCPFVLLLFSFVFSPIGLRALWCVWLCGLLCIVSFVEIPQKFLVYIMKG